MKVSPLINNFSAGEFGPLTSARVDLDRYKSSLEICENYIPRIQGGATRREGTKYVSSTKSDGKVRLEKFIFSNNQAYVLEFGDYYIRFYTNGSQIKSGGNPIEVSSPYYGDYLFELNFCQSNDILYIFHESFTTAKLVRSTNTIWDLSGITFLDGPYRSSIVKDYVSTRQQLFKIKPSAETGSITLNTPNVSIGNVTNSGVNNQILITYGVFSSKIFFDGDRVTISGVTGTTEANGSWFIKVVSSSSFLLVGSVYANAYIAGGNIYQSLFYTALSGMNIRIEKGGDWYRGLLTAITNEYTATCLLIDDLPAGSAGGVVDDWRLGLYGTGKNASSGCFHEDRLFMCGPNQYIAGSVVGDYENFQQSDRSTSTVADSDAVVFSLNSNDTNNAKWIISDEKGLLVGTTANEWLIKSADTTSPITPTSITAKKVTSFGSKSTQPVQAGKAAIFVQGSGRKVREFNYFYDVDGFRAQDLTQLSHYIAKSGIKQMSLQKQPEQIVWCVREDGQLAAMTYERDIDGLRVAWHRHIIGGYSDAANNNSIVESVCVIPTSDNSYDEVWISVKRYINGNTKRYIEYIGKPFDLESEQQDAFFLDSGLTYNVPKTITAATKANPCVVTSAGHGFSNGDKVRIDGIVGMSQLNGNLYKVKNVAANTFELTDYDGNNINSSSFSTYVSGGSARKLVTSISGLSHLEGQTVQVLCDGADGGTYTVSSGAITLDDPSAIVHVGLGYDSKMKLPRLDAGSQDGTSLGKTRRIHRLGIMMHRSLGLKIGENFTDMVDLEFQSGNDQLNQAAPLFTGIKSEEFSATYDFENNICIRQNQPLPSTILAIMPQMVTQDR